MKPPEHPWRFEHAIVYNVVDGDTCDLVVDLGFMVSLRHRFRLARINAPEVGTPGGAEATAFLKHAVLGKNVIVESRKADDYGRFLGELWTDTTKPSVNQQMLDKGFAVPWPKP